MARLIVIEGLDGSGKDTQAKLLTRTLTDEGEPTEYVTINDVYGLSDFIDLKYAVSGHNPTTNKYTLPVMFLAGYLEFSTYIKTKYLDNGISVVVPRWDLSMFAYSILGDDVTKNKNANIFNGMTDLLLKPDIYLFLDVDVNTCTKRIMSRGLQLDIYENDINVMKSINEKYKTLIKHFTNKNIMVVNGNGDINNINNNIKELLW